MALEDVKEQLREQLQTLAARIQESPAWQELMERYQSLSPSGQKAALGGVGAIFALFLLLFPWFFYSSSMDSMTEFEDKKQLIRELYRYSHAASTLPPAPIPVSAGELRNAVQGLLSSQHPILLPEQTASISDFDNGKAKSAALPSGLTQSGIAVNLSRLNLDQVVKIGAALQNLRPTAKIVGLKVQATAADPHYFDVTYKLVAFNLPSDASGGMGGKPGANSPGKKGLGK